MSESEIKINILGRPTSMDEADPLYTLIAKTKADPTTTLQEYIAADVLGKVPRDYIRHVLGITSPISLSPEVQKHLARAQIDTLKKVKMELFSAINESKSSGQYVLLAIRPDDYDTAVFLIEPTAIKTSNTLLDKIISKFKAVLSGVDDQAKALGYTFQVFMYKPHSACDRIAFTNISINFNYNFKIFRIGTTRQQIADRVRLEKNPATFTASGGNSTDAAHYFGHLLLSAATARHHDVSSFPAELFERDLLADQVADRSLQDQIKILTD